MAKKYENEKELTTLLDEFCDSNAKLSKEELHQIAFLLGDKQEDEYVTQWLQQDWANDSEGFGKLNRERIFACVKPLLEKNTNKRLSFMQVLYRCAAALLLPALGLSAYFIMQTINLKQSVQTEIVEILVPSGTESTITLADGSTVTLKDGSRLSQKSNFNGKTREIFLEGEAFFDIAHNPNKPFIVHAKGTKTTALGTSFIVKAMSDESSITVTVVEGKVKVEEGTKLLATLEANQQFIHGIEFDHSREKIAEVETKAEIETEPKAEVDWQPHDLFFNNMLFGDIVQDLAIRHGVNVVVENEELKRRRIHVLLDNRNSIDELLKFLCTSQQATYTVQGNMYTIK